jgi:hypothetical protein
MSQYSIIIIAGLLLLALYIFWIKIVGFLLDIPLLIKSRNWEKTFAKIINIKPSAKIGTRGPLTALFQWHIYDVNYRYEYNDKEYKGTSIIDFKPKTKQLHIRVNPANPNQTHIYK